MINYPTAHAYHRAWERYGLNLTPEMHETLVKNIGAADRARKMGMEGRSEIWYLATPRGPANVLYDPRLKKIITFLPKGIDNVRGVKVPVVRRDSTLVPSSPTHGQDKPLTSGT